MAIAETHLGNYEKARECLAKGRDLFKSVQPAQPGEPSRVDAPCEWMAMTLLSQEAEKCLHVAEVGKTKTSAAIE
jgi:hypothetical protein